MLKAWNVLARRAPRLLGPLGLAALLGACFAPLAPRAEPLTDPAARDRLAVVLLPPFRAERLVIRAVLQRNDVESNATVYFRASAPDALEIAAIGDLGGTLFEATIRGDQIALGARSPLLEEEFLRDQLLPDLAAAFVPLSRDAASAVKLGDGDTGLRAVRPAALGGEVRTFAEVPPAPRIVERVRSGRKAARLEILPPAGLTEPAEPVRHVSAEGFGHRYRAWLDVVERSPIAAEAP